MDIDAPEEQWIEGMTLSFGCGITVNCVPPGLIDTAQIHRRSPGEEHKKFAEREIALRDFGQPVHVGDAVTFLASPARATSSALCCW